MSERINNFKLPVRMRLDSANRTYYTVCSGFWSTLRALLENEYLAQAAFNFVQKGLPEHFVVEAPTVPQAADAAVRLLPLLRERYLWEHNRAVLPTLPTAGNCWTWPARWPRATTAPSAARWRFSPPGRAKIPVTRRCPPWAAPKDAALCPGRVHRRQC